MTVLHWRKTRVCITTMVVWAAVCACSHAGTIRLRLVRADAPDQLVSTAVTEIRFQEELDAEAAAQAGIPADDVDDEGVATLPQDEGPKDEEQRTKADFDRYVNYMRGILIDGKLPFQKMYKGSFLGRSAEITLKLEDGDHVIDPGGHRFSVQGDRVQSDDPDIRCEGNALSIAAYPVTFIAVDAAVVRPVPADLRRLPLRPMIYHNDELLLPLERRLSPNATFKRLTLYMLGTGGTTYRLTPTNQHFTVDPGGVRVVDAQGNGQDDASVSVEDKFTLVLPQFQIPLTINAAPGRKVQVVMSGDSGRIRAANDTRSPVVRAFSSEQGSTIKIGSRVQSRAVPFHGDLLRYPLRRIVVDATAPEADEPRMLIAAWGERKTRGGESLEMRIRYLDSLDHSTVSPVQIAAFYYDRGILNPDGTLGGDLPGTAPRADPSGFVDEEPPAKGRWQSLRITRTGEAQVYQIHLPKVPDSVYSMRVVCDRRGQAGPESALCVEFAHAVVGADDRGTLSLFLPAGRHALRPGEPLDIHVAAKSNGEVQGGRLTVDLIRDQQQFNLATWDAVPGGGKRRTWSFELPAGVTSLLRPGRYEMIAHLGDLTSNRYELLLAEPKYDLSLIHI